MRIQIDDAAFPLGDFGGLAACLLLCGVPSGGFQLELRPAEL